jgi:hypothetical protein
VPIKIALFIHLSICMKHFESGWTDFQEIWYCGVLQKSFDTFQFLLKLDNNNGYFTWRPTCVSACGNDWVSNPQTILITTVSFVAVVTWGIFSQSHTYVGESSMMVSTTPSQIQDTPSHTWVIDPRQLWYCWCHLQRSNSGNAWELLHNAYIS